MIRKCLVLFIAVLTGALGHKALTRDRVVSPLNNPRTASPTQRYNEVRLSRFDLDNETMRRALEKVAAAFHVGIAADWNRLDYNKAVLVSVHLKDVSLEDAVGAIVILNDRGSIRTHLLNDILLINGEYGDGWRRPETHVYDVRDLIQDWVNYDIQPAQLLVESVEGKKTSDPDDYRVATVQFLESLKRAMHHNGFGLEVDEVAGRLIITTDTETHEHIEQVLHDLRWVAKKPLALVEAVAPHDSDVPVTLPRYQAEDATEPQVFGPPFPPNLELAPTIDPPR